MNEIWIAVLIVTSIGLVAGIGLAIASAVMAVPKDEKAEAVLEILPGANCGACGYSGCSGYAAALSKGEAKAGLCSPGGAEVAAAIAKVLGTEPVGVEYQDGAGSLYGLPDNTQDKMRYQGQPSCAAAAQFFGGVAACLTAVWALGTARRCANIALSPSAMGLQASTQPNAGAALNAWRPAPNI